MTAIENMLTRRSVRAYKSDMVPKEIIEKIVEAGTYAVTGMNRQSPIIIAVTNKELRDRLSAMNARIMGTDTDPFYGAPVVLIVLADKSMPTYLYDGSLVMGILCLPLTLMVLTAVGFIVQRKNLKQLREKKFSLHLVLQGITRVSVTAF